jgi:hypothetical protein
MLFLVACIGVLESSLGNPVTSCRCRDLRTKSPHPNSEVLLVSPRQTAIYVMYPTAHDI